MPAHASGNGQSPQIAQPHRTAQKMKLYSNGATIDDGAIL